MKTKTSKLFGALAFALIFALSCMNTAFAAGTPIYGTESAPAQAAITKILQMPIGTNTPKADFIFEVKAISADGADATPSNMPPIGNITLSSANTMNGTTTGNIKRIILESADIFKNVTFSHAGTYVYEITEIEKTNPAIDNNTDHESLTYSPAKYELTVLVMNKKAPATGTYIYAIGDVIIIEDNDEQKKGDKVDPTPLDPDVSGDYSKMIFTNTYVKTNGPGDPENPEPEDATLSVSKKVTGDLGNLELYFDYSMTITVPSLVAEPKAYKAYVVDTDDTFVSAADLVDLNNATVAGTDKNGNAYIEFNNKAAVTFSLKHGQKLAFIDTPVGTSYNVEEAKAAGYIPNVSVVYDGGMPTVTTNTLENIDFGVIGKLVGEKTNSADFINERKDVSITGLDFSSLPFVGMIALALGVAALLFVSKARKAKNNYN